MSTTLERTAPPAPSPAVAPASRLARWWGQWRVALRLARRDAWRAKGRSLLVLLLIAVPVGAVAGVDIYSQASAALRSDRAQALASLGSAADARLYPVGSGPVRQGVLGSPMSGSDTPDRQPAPAEILAALPAGSRLAALGGESSVILESGAWGGTANVLVQDTEDPLVAGTWRVRDGRLPTAPGELAVSSPTARRLHLEVGSVASWQTLDAPKRQGTFAVVGVVDPASTYSGLDGVVATGALPAASTGQGYLAAIPGGLDWTGVRRLNFIGVVAVSRAVVEEPPAFCPTDVLCLDSGPVPKAEPLDDGSGPTLAESAAQNAAQIAVGLVVVVLQIALLAGPAFAVQLRRRQRELGLVGASGGDAATMRRTVLASGVVLGVGGAALGVAAAWTAVWALSGNFRFQPLGDTLGAKVAVPPLPGELLGIALVGVVAAVIAALVPAVVAGRGDVVDTLRGRRALPPVRRGVPVLGLLLGVVGVALVAYGVARYDGVVIGIGIVVGEIGLLVVMPALVAWLSRPAARLPLSARLAVRDAGRHRMRTTAAAIAIAAAAAGATGAAAIAATVDLESASSGVAYPGGSRIVFISPKADDTGATIGSSEPFIEPALASIARALPGATVEVLTDLLPTGYLTSGATITCLAPESPRPATPGKDPCTQRETPRGTYSGSSLLLLRDPATLASLLGPLAPVDEARAALERGDVLALGYNSVGADGRTTLAVDVVKDDGTTTTLRSVDLPAYVVGAGAAPGLLLVGPAALERGKPLAGLVEGGASLAVVQPATPDSADAPSAIDRIALQFQKDGLGGLGYADPSGGTDPATIVLVAAAGVTAAVAVLVGLMVTALALVDGRADSRTLASVGGPPVLRRRMAASSAGFVTVLGCVTGVVSGLVAAWVLAPLFSVQRGSHLFVVPWLEMAALVVAVPLITAAAAWLTTRSRIPLTRHPD